MTRGRVEGGPQGSRHSTRPGSPVGGQWARPAPGLMPAGVRAVGALHRAAPLLSSIARSRRLPLRHPTP